MTYILLCYIILYLCKILCEYWMCWTKRVCYVYFTAGPPSASNSKQPSSQQHQHHQHRTRRTQRRVTHNEKRYHSGTLFRPLNFCAFPLLFDLYNNYNYDFYFERYCHYYNSIVLYSGVLCMVFVTFI